MFNRKTICEKCGVVLLKSKAKKVEERRWKFAYPWSTTVPIIRIKNYCSVCAPPYDTVQYDIYNSVSGYFAKLEVKADGTPVGYVNKVEANYEMLLKIIKKIKVENDKQLKEARDYCSPKEKS